MDQLIEKHIRYAHAIARSLLSRYPSNVSQRDLESAAEFGLVQAGRAYDPTRGIPFTTFAYYRIRGAIFDEIRQLCRASCFEAAASDYMAEQTTAAHVPENAEAAYQELRGITSHLVSSYLLSLDSVREERIAEASTSPVGQVLHQEETEIVRKAMEQLPERYRTVLHAYYYQELSLESIGKRLNLSKSWVSRLHAKALSRLHEILKQSSVRQKKANTQAGKQRKNGVGQSNSTVVHTITQWESNGSRNEQFSGELVACA
jgi:RNA polymerase sigma factor for flagellar operon FliA